MQHKILELYLKLLYKTLIFVAYTGCAGKILLEKYNSLENGWKSWKKFLT